MDWGRAKTILILSFLLLNMVLGFQLWTASKSKQTELAADTSGVIEELNRVLQSKNIRLTEELPKDVPELKAFTVKFDESIKLGEHLKLKTPTTMTSILAKGAGKKVQTLSEIPHFDQYQFDSVTSKNGVFTFNQMYGELPMFDVRVELYEENGEITSYRQAYVEVESGVEQKEQKLISAQMAVRSLVENYLSEGSMITEVRLGYHGQLYNSQTQYIFPYWRVTVDGDIYYLQALNGAVEEPHRGGDQLQFGPELPEAKEPRR